MYFKTKPKYRNICTQIQVFDFETFRFNTAVGRVWGDTPPAGVWGQSPY